MDPIGQLDHAVEGKCPHYIHIAAGQREICGATATHQLPRNKVCEHHFEEWTRKADAMRRQTRR